MGQVITTKGEELMVDTPSKLPAATERESILEPYVRVEMLSPTEYTGQSGTQAGRGASIDGRARQGRMLQ